jgi:hypothetical protein
MEADLDAEFIVRQILPCPPIKPGNGRIVLTTINHFNTDVWTLVVRDERGREETLQPTGRHPFYSATRRTTVSTKSLDIGETLLGSSDPVTVVSLTRHPGKHRVFNMTVQGEHVYRVSLLGVLTHNNCSTATHAPTPFPTQKFTGLTGQSLHEAQYQYFLNALRNGADPAMLRGQAQVRGYTRYGGWNRPTEDRLASKPAEAALQRAIRDASRGGS